MNYIQNPWSLTDGIPSSKLYKIITNNMVTTNYVISSSLPCDYTYTDFNWINGPCVNFNPKYYREHLTEDIHSAMFVNPEVKTLLVRIERYFNKDKIDDHDKQLEEYLIFLKVLKKLQTWRHIDIIIVSKGNLNTYSCDSRKAINSLHYLDRISELRTELNINSNFNELVDEDGSHLGRRVTCREIKKGIKGVRNYTMWNDEVNTHLYFEKDIEIYRGKQ